VHACTQYIERKRVRASNGVCVGAGRAELEAVYVHVRKREGERKSERGGEKERETDLDSLFVSGAKFLVVFFLCVHLYFERV